MSCDNQVLLFVLHVPSIMILALWSEREEEKGREAQKIHCCLEDSVNIDKTSLNRLHEICNALLLQIIQLLYLSAFSSVLRFLSQVSAYRRCKTDSTRI